MRRHKQIEQHNHCIIDVYNRHTFSAAAPEAALITIKAAEANNSFMVDLLMLLQEIYGTMMNYWQHAIFLISEEHNETRVVVVLKILPKSKISIKIFSHSRVFQH